MLKEIKCNTSLLGFSTTRALDLSTHNLRIRKQLLDRQLKKVMHHISRAKNVSKAAKRAIYNARRIGLDSQSLTHITRHMARMLRYAKVANHLGRISIGLGVVSTTVDTFNGCEKSQDGWICGRAVAGNAAGFAGGMWGSAVGAKLARFGIENDAVENVSKSLLGREIRCNASLDIETEGAGIVICQVMITFAGSYAGGAGLSWMFNKGSRSIYSSIFHMPGD